MGTQRKRGLLALCFSLTALLGLAIAALDLDTGNEAYDSSQGAVAGADPDCDVIGHYDTLNSRTYRYRGDVYRFEFPARLKEIKMELAFSGTTDLHVAIHRKDPVDGSYKRYPESSSDIVIGGAVGLGAGVPKFYTTGILDDPVDLVAGFDYAIAFAWGAEAVTHGYDNQFYPVPFRAGQVLGLVAETLSPPPEPLVPETFPEFLIFPDGAYSMELCFEPEPGACCSSALGHCEEMLETECLASEGSFFYGERTLCAETACAFGACCTACGDCQSGFTSEACAADVESRHWSDVSCPVNPQDLCPVFLGACCRGTTCSAECRDDCENPPPPIVPGTYRGNGTDCSPNECPGATGACCISGGCINQTLANCTLHNGTYRGPGTTCLTLEPECGGACCAGYALGVLEYCRLVASRADCSVGPKGDPFPYSAYRGDGTTCPLNCNDREYLGCCLPDGTCINVPTSGHCQASWIKGVPQAAGVICEDPSATFCPSTLRRCCFPDGSCDLLTPTGCLAFGGTPNEAATDCPVNVCTSTSPTGACCGNTPGQCVVKTEAQCDSQGDLYQGDGTTCDAPTTTCPGFGACCLDDGECLDDFSSSQCSLIGGVYRSDGSVCQTILDCDQRGACCASTGTCLFITESQCSELFPIPGEFSGIGVPCAANTCPAGACCLPGGCETRTQTSCLAYDGVFQDVGIECTPDLCTIGACCNGETCSSQTQYTCERDGGTYLGGGVVCVESVCALGACCDDVTCSQLQVPLCVQQGGVFLGEGVACAESVCILGACCEDETCSQLLGPLCETQGGIFLEAGVACETDICTVGACCNGDTCSSQTRFTCERGGGTYLGNGVACVESLCALGACCRDEACTPLQELLCTQQDGVFLGGGVNCTEVLCVNGACCSTDCTCAEVRGSECVGPESTFQPGDACVDGPCTSEIINSSPPNCAIDAREPHEPDDATVPLGWDTFDLTFRCGAAGTTETDFTVDVEPSATPPTIVGATVSVNTVTLTLDRPIDAQAWTCFTHTESSNRICFGALPADSDASRMSEAPDVQALVENLADPLTIPPLESWQCDVDHSGQCSPADILTEADLLNGADEFEGWADMAMIACPTAPSP